MKLRSRIQYFEFLFNTIVVLICSKISSYHTGDVMKILEHREFDRTCKFSKISNAYFGAVFFSLRVITLWNSRICINFAGSGDERWSVLASGRPPISRIPTSLSVRLKIRFKKFQFSDSNWWIGSCRIWRRISCTSFIP